MCLKYCGILDTYTSHTEPWVFSVTVLIHESFFQCTKGASLTHDKVQTEMKCIALTRIPLLASVCITVFSKSFSSLSKQLTCTTSAQIPITGTMQIPITGMMQISITGIMQIPITGIMQIA